MKVGVTTVSFSSNRILLDKLRKTGLDIKVNPFGRRMTTEELIEFLKDCDSAIIGLDKINSRVLEKCPRLRLISKYGVGLDNIDFLACKKYGVEVKFPTGVNKRSVSEMALAMMICLTRNIYSTSIELKKGNWNKSGGFELSGKKIGIIGFGNIGRDLAYLLSVFQVELFVNDIIETSLNEFDNIKFVSKEFIYSNCDIISIHTPLTPKTKNLISAEMIHQLKDGVIIINTARGGILNEKDVYEALCIGKIRGLGIDAYEVEPADGAILGLPNVICTPHIGGNSEEAVLAMGIAAISNCM